jgi:transposase
MPAPYQDDLRRRMVRAVSEGAAVREVADLYDVAPSTVVKVHQRWRETGTVSAKSMGGDRRSHGIEAQAETILRMIGAKPDLTLDEICEALEAKGVRVSRSALWRFFERHDVRFKKKRRMPVSKSAPTSSPRAKRGASKA